MSPAPVVREKRSKSRNHAVGNVSRPSVMAPCSGRDRARRRMMIAVDSSSMETCSHAPYRRERQEASLPA
jgi:hypothetical protein